MKNHVQNGAMMTFTNGTGGDIASGAAVVIGQQIGVAAVAIADTETGEVAMEGVFELPKVSAAVIGQGESVIWDASAGAFDDNQATPATGDVSGACTAWEAAGNGVTTVKVKLNTGVGTVA
jgi:predicted RecA/RadA family phage recombinase